MLIFRKRKNGFSYSHIWFAEKPRPIDATKACAYLQCNGAESVAGFVKSRFRTKIVDLSLPAEDILHNMNESTAYKIRRAQRSGMAVTAVPEIDSFLDFYNAFAETKGRDRLSATELDNWGTDTVALASVRDDEPLAMHSYIVDHNVSRARLLHSASLFRRHGDSSTRSDISRANCCLHFEAMLHFKRLGIRDYDLGGFASGSPSRELAQIAQFKAGFGGREVEETSYVSFAMLMLQATLRIKRRTMRGR